MRLVIVSTRMSVVKVKIVAILMLNVSTQAVATNVAAKEISMAMVPFAKL